jgi:hypothetical protein
MTVQFDAPDLALLREEDEIEIETAAGDEGPTHRTIIWVVVDDRDRVLVRSYRGPGARWFREITARRESLVRVRERDLPVRAIPANDDDRIEACSTGLRLKYADDPAMPRMLRDHLETTLELVPR